MCLLKKARHLLSIQVEIAVISICKDINDKKRWKCKFFSVNAKLTEMKLKVKQCIVMSSVSENRGCRFRKPQCGN